MKPSQWNLIGQIELHQVFKNNYLGFCNAKNKKKRLAAKVEFFYQTCSLFQSNYFLSLFLLLTKAILVGLLFEELQAFYQKGLSVLVILGAITDFHISLAEQEPELAVGWGLHFISRAPEIGSLVLP
ncbi:MAG: hypothetical protein ACXVHM_07035 [Methanobacterium sp.]